LLFLAIAFFLLRVTAAAAAFCLKGGCFLAFFSSFSVEVKHCNNGGCYDITVAKLCLQAGRFFVLKAATFLYSFLAAASFWPLYKAAAFFKGSCASEAMWPV
jgi:hypothetical protein